MSAALSVTARGRVTLAKEVLQHLGIGPEGKVELRLLPDGRAELRAASTESSSRGLQGILKSGTNGARLSISQITEAIAEGGLALPDNDNERGNSAPDPREP